MADAFDPYRDWLGLNFAEREYPLNHYQILGLDRRDTDAEGVQHAADEMLARVRSQRPGDRAADWSRLLDEIEAARDCLSDPNTKTAYDAQLVSSNLQRVAAPDPSSDDASTADGKPLNLDQGAWSPPSFDARPIESPDSQASSTQADAPAMPSAPTVVPAPSATMPTDSTPVPTDAAPPAPAAFPRAPFDQENPATGQPTFDTPPTAQPVTAADPMAPVAIPTASPTSAPVATPTAVASASETQATASQPIVDAALMPPDPALAIETDEQRPARSRLSRTALFGIVAALLLWVAGMATFFSGVLSSKNDVVGKSETEKNDIGKTTKPEGKAPPLGPLPTFPVPSPATQPKPTPAPVPIPTPTPDPTPSPDPFVPTPSPTPPPSPTPMPEPSPSPMPEPPPAPVPVPKPEGPTREQITAYLGHLKSSRAALTARDLTSSQTHLDEAYKLTPLTPELEARLERLQALHDATADFWLTTAESIAKLEGGEEFQISESTIIRVIEVTSREILIRIAGQTKRYPVKDPPMGIARLLVATSLGKDSPRTLIAFGASWATIPAADLDKARKYFRQAAGAGVDTSKLLQAIEDDYRLPQS